MTSCKLSIGRLACIAAAASCLTASLSSASVETNAPPKFKLPSGFSIQRVAGSPAIHFPMFGTLDERGRLFVTESSGGDLYAELQRKVKSCRISQLIDTNGDGVFDRATVFTTGLAPSMGLVWRQQKLFVADPPDLAVFEDTDDDGQADKRTVLLRGFGHTDNGSLHGLTFGPDGWLYFTMGNPDGYDLTGPDGSNTASRTGALIRCRPDGTRLETVAVGFENLVEVAWLRDGSIIGTVNWYYLPERGVRDALVQLLEGGQYPLHALNHGVGAVNFNALLPPISVYPAVAHSGLMRYIGSAFPSEMHDNLFSAQHNTRKIVRHVLAPKGASYSVTDVDFITTDDPSVHFSDVLQDADGTLLAIDTGSWYVHHCPTGQIIRSPAQGGIYRVRYAAGSSSEPARHRQPDPTPVATSAIALREQLRSTNPIEAAFAVRALGRLEEKPVAAELIPLLTSTNQQLRLAAAEALAHCGGAQTVPALIDALADVSDDFLTHALTFALHRLAGRAALEQGLHHPSPKVQRACLLLLAQGPFHAVSPEAASAGLFAPDPGLRETARWILEQHPEWGEAGAQFIIELLKLKEPAEADRIALEKTLPQIQTNRVVIETIAHVLNGIETDTNHEQQSRLLEALAEANLQELPDSWAEAIRSLLANGPPALREPALRAAGAWKISGVEPSLNRIADNPDEDPQLRVLALRELVRRQPKLANSAFAFLTQQLASDRPAAARLGAAEALLAARLSASQWTAFLTQVQGDSLILPATVLAVVEGQNPGQYAAALLQYLNASLDAGWTFPADRVLAMKQTLTSAQQEHWQKLLDRLNQMGDRQKQKLTAYQPLLTGGDREKGQRLFYGKAQCSICHSVWGIGGKVGPDLSKLGSIRASQDILESIVVPSASIAQGYDLLNVNLKDGESVSGIRVGKSENPLVLRDATGRDTRYSQSSIQSVERSKLSLMPEGLLQSLTEEEIRDLLAFLQTLK